MSSSEPLGTIVFAAWNGAALTERFLASFARESRHAWDLIAVDNGSTDSTPTLLRDWSRRLRLRVLRNEDNLGCAKAWNRGLREAIRGPSPLFGILNNDLVFAPGWDEGLREFSVRHPVAAFCPHVLEGELADFPSRAERFMRRNRARTRDRMQSEALFLRREVLERVGYFDERFFVSFEDFDYFLRMREAGITPVSTGASVVWHKPKETRRHLPSQHEVDGRELFKGKWGEARLGDPGFEVPRWRRRYWRWRERFGIL